MSGQPASTELPIERVLRALRDHGVKTLRKSGDGWLSSCPSHEDREPSLSIRINAKDDALIRCHAGCPTQTVVATIGLEMRDLFADSGRHDHDRSKRSRERPRGPVSRSSASPENGSRLAVSEEDVTRWRSVLLADERVLSRLSELRGWTREAVEELGLGLDGDRIVFPVRDPAGQLVGVTRYAPNPERRDGPKTVAAAGSRRQLFPAPETVAEGDDYLWLVEGEADCVAATSIGLPAVAIPGVQGWKPEMAGRFAGGRRVVIVMDCDGPGREAAQRVSCDLADVAEEVRVADLNPDREDGYDLTDLILAGLNGDRTPAAYASARQNLFDTLARSTTMVEGASDNSDNPTNTLNPAPQAGSECRMAGPTTIGQLPDLALASDILDRFEADLGRLGVAGEERIAKVTFLALTSRLLPWGKASNRPVSLITKGTSSSGKSYVTAAVIEFMPQGTVISLMSSSRLYLLYSERSLEHRFLYVPEWSAIAEQDELVTLLRVLVSEGHVEHGTVEGAGRKEARELRKDGPTGLLMTTTAALTDTELETRCLALRTDDSPEQTRRIFAAIADLESVSGDRVDFAPWHELQLWLEQQDNRVVIPFVDALAQLMPTSATRLRRDFVSVLCLVRAHAILHQATRDRDADGRIIATLDDYAAVRLLVGELVAEGADAFVPEAIRSTVEAVRSIIEDGEEYATPKAVEERLAIGRGATYDRIGRALLVGYLVNVTKEGERGKKLRPGQPLPDEPEFLPSSAGVEALVRSLSDGRSDNANGMVERFSGGLSDVRSCRTPLGGDAVNNVDGPRSCPTCGGTIGSFTGMCATCHERRLERADTLDGEAA